MRKNLGLDPFEVFWEDPKTFYQAMEKIFGSGTKVLINLLVKSINKEQELNIDPNNFLEFIRNGSVEQLHSLLMKIAESYRSKGGMEQE